MNRSKLISDIREYLLSRRVLLRRYLTGELANIGTDADEESLDDEAYFGMAVSESKELELVQAALERFRKGTYGVCESCQREIASSRLQALPCAGLCIACQRDYETTGASDHHFGGAATSLPDQFAS